VSPEGPDGEYSRWLRFQVWLAAAGILTWFAGAASDSSFVAGVGTGIMASALALRILRGRRPEEGSGGDGA
jgi:hypothetical protein